MLFRLAAIAAVCGCGAPTVTALQKWEYTCKVTDRDVAKFSGFEKYLESSFNALGEEGWEMVGYAMNNGANARYVCFKRPKQAPEEA